MASTQETLKFPADLAVDESKRNFIRFRFYKKSLTSPNKVDNPGVNSLSTNSLKKTDRIKPDIYLPLIPDIFRENLSTSYYNEDLGPLGKLLYDKVQDASLSPGAFSKVMGEATSFEAAENVASALALSSIASTDIEAVNAGLYAAGIAYNPNLTLFFNGSQQNYRYFNIGWTLYPKSEKEADDLLSIEKTFVKYALPGTLNKGITSDLNYNNHYTYPYEVHISVYVDGEMYRKFQFMPAHLLYVNISHQDSQQQNEISFLKRPGSIENKLYYSGTTLTLGIQEKEVYIRQYVDNLKT